MENKDFNNKIDALDRVAAELPKRCGVVALNFIHDRFKAQNWIGYYAEPWKRRKNPTKWGKVKRNSGRALLVDTRRLQRSIRLETATQEHIIIATNEPYAKAHNEGFRGTVQQNVKQHTRKRTRPARTKTGKKSKREVVGSSTVKAHKRTIRQNIPRRQFMGESPYLLKAIEREVTAQFMKALKS